MNRKKRRKPLNRYVLIGPIIFFVFLVGCEKQNKHRLLTFFFTGVPPLEGENLVVDETDMGALTASVRRKPSPKPTIFLHAPYAEKRCDQCHQTSSMLSFRSFGQEQPIKTSSPARGGLSGMYVKPISELCTMCHTYLSAPDSLTKGLWLHAPAAQGNCMLCHRPHESKNRFLLTKKPDQICSQCHKEGLLIKTDDHQTSKTCVFCHNPHLGKNPVMLKKDFEEVRQPVEPLADRLSLE